MTNHIASFYPPKRAVSKTSEAGVVMTPASVVKALLPTLAVVGTVELVLRYTGSGYSVAVITLLSVVLFTAFRSGVVLGLVSAFVVVLYNFFIVSRTMDSGLFTYETLESGGVIAVVFPMLALIIGLLKARNDSLLRSEQTARLKAEESAHQLQFMAESMPQKIFTIYPNGKAAYVNPQWGEYTGASRKKMADWSNIVHPHDKAENMRLWKESLETGEPFQFEHRLKRADGTYVWHLTRARALRDKKGNITLWIGSSTDIENVRRARKLESETARLIKQRTELMELNKAKDEFISLASHQLRTPATGVKQYINMALDGYGGKVPPKIKIFLERANKSNERQLDVISDLLKVAQVDAGKVVLRKELVDVNKAVTNILYDQRSVFESRKQRIKYVRKPKGMTVNADPTKLRMIIENILDNASKYSHENTTITVTLTKYRGTVRIAVKDQGVGIDKADTRKIFEKFIRIDNPLSNVVGGNGLGLYWAQKVVELHGGTITLSSVKDTGTTFTVALPASTT